MADPFQPGPSAGPAGPDPQGHLVHAMWSWAATHLQPAQALRRSGISAFTEPVQGRLPDAPSGSGLGPRFSVGRADPVFLDEATEHDHLVEDFDRFGEVYEAFVRSYSTPIFEEGLEEFRAYLPDNARVLDAGCGSGRELRTVARLVPDGEVVGIDLAAGMVEAAHRSARAHGLDHCAFYQADVGRLPEEFTGAFDLVYSCLAHHHYPEPEAAAEEVHRVLRPGGVYCIVDPGPEWFNRLSAPVARWADPGWIGFHSPDEFRALLGDAGFEPTAWVPTLPGFGVAIGQKPPAG